MSDKAVDLVIEHRDEKKSEGRLLSYKNDGSVEMAMKFSAQGSLAADIEQIIDLDTVAAFERGHKDVSALKSLIDPSSGLPSANAGRTMYTIEVEQPVYLFKGSKADYLAEKMENVLAPEIRAALKRNPSLLAEAFQVERTLTSVKVSFNMYACDPDDTECRPCVSSEVMNIKHR